MHWLSSSHRGAQRFSKQRAPSLHSRSSVQQGSPAGRVQLTPHAMNNAMKNAVKNTVKNALTDAGETVGVNIIIVVADDARNHESASDTRTRTYSRTGRARRAALPSFT